MAEFLELYMDQGADFSTTISLNDDDTNMPQNVAGYVITSHMRKSLLSVNATASFRCSILGPASEGEILMEMTAANTANIKAGSYFFDVKVREGTNPAYTYTRLIEGIIYVTPSITR